MRNILVTGGAGFIGSHVVRLFVNKYPNDNIINLDTLTYAGNLENLKDVQDSPNYLFVKGDICDADFMDNIFDYYNITHVVHLAAESHVDRSITDPLTFVKTNVMGTVNLLNAAVGYWDLDESCDDDHMFYHVSTDEVYGSLGDEGLFTETTPYDPKSPYSASKASSDHFVRAYANTYNLPIVISNCSNNYGANQFPEKLIPLVINNILNKKPIPIYGKGDNIRDWLYVNDHASAIDKIFHEGKKSETYNIGGLNEWTNIDLITLLCNIMDKKLDRKAGESVNLIKFVKDRSGHDKRYAIDASKLIYELQWTPSLDFETGLKKTVDWYLENEEWLKNIESGDYQNNDDDEYLDPSSVLYDADPNCEHKIKMRWSGYGCTKCTGWFCA